MKVDIVPLTSIEFGNRYREEMGDLDALVNSIITKGIISPLTVQDRANVPGSSHPYSLVAGGRRFTACHLAGIEKVPVRIYDHALTELELRAIELEENIQRKDLEWIEQVNLQREIHRLQIEIHGAKTSTADDATGWSMRDTAKLLGKSAGGISMDLKLAEAVEQLPELEWADCKTKSDAMKLLTRIEETAIRAELSKRAQESFTNNESLPVKNSITARRQRLISSYIINDFHKAALKLDPGMFNFVEVDPPYAINLSKMKRKDGISKYTYGANGYNEVELDDYVNFMHITLQHCYRLMADNSWLVLWFAPEPWAEIMFELVCETGFQTSRITGIWAKPSGQSMNPSTRLASAYEPFYVARKGDPALARPGSINVFPFTQVAGKKKTHPTERPLELMRSIIQTFAFPNASVLVPFAGSGVSLLAAHQLQMHPIGFDLNQGYKDSFTVRVMQSQEV